MKAFAGKLGIAGSFVGLYSDVQQWKDEETLGRRLAFLATGTALSICGPAITAAIAGSSLAPVVGTLIGLTIGLTFQAVELIHDLNIPTAKRFIFDLKMLVRSL